MKRLKFSENLVPLVVSKEKDTTWRINDDKFLTVGDSLSLCDKDGEEFGKAEILWVKDTFFKNLTTEDFEGHEKFSSEEEMLSTYSKYYSMDVTKETKVKVIKFKLKG